MLPAQLAEMLACPESGESFASDLNELRSLSGRRIPLVDGVPLFAANPTSSDARRQQQHYDKVCEAYLENLAYPHTQEYFAYLDLALHEHVGKGALGDVLEVCCGRGEALQLYADRIVRGVGVDISLGMLRAGRPALPEESIMLVQGDATRLPLRNDAFDHVFTLGGIHHINDRRRLFSEVHRVLKPGGRFIWREPANDFLLWRALRSIIYRVSPALDADTEHPLRYSETCDEMKVTNLCLRGWQTYGFFGFCLFMNSDVLVFNRLFRCVPGIRRLTRWFAKLDDMITSRRMFQKLGLQVIGVATKPLEIEKAKPRAA